MKSADWLVDYVSYKSELFCAVQAACFSAVVTHRDPRYVVFLYHLQVSHSHLQTTSLKLIQPWHCYIRSSLYNRDTVTFKLYWRDTVTFIQVYTVVIGLSTAQTYRCCRYKRRQNFHAVRAGCQRAYVHENPHKDSTKHQNQDPQQQKYPYSSHSTAPFYHSTPFSILRSLSLFAFIHFYVLLVVLDDVFSYVHLVQWRRWPRW